MTYQIPYEADFRCPKGHEFTAPASPFDKAAEVICPECYAAWVAANVPAGVQVGKARQVAPGVAFT